MNTISIGRAPQNNYVINDRTEVTSRFHADLFVNGDGTYTLTDHSSHGTTVNGQLLHHSSRPVRYGDSIVFANTAQFDWSRVGTGPWHHRVMLSGKWPKTYKGQQRTV